MLNIGLQIYFLDSPVDEWGCRWKIWAENWFIDANSARRNRCERSRKPPKGYPARLACWHCGSPISGKTGKLCQTHIKKQQKLIFTGQGFAEMSNGCIVLDKKMCPDALEALKPSGDPSNASKWGMEVGWSGGVPPWPKPIYALRGIFTCMALGLSTKT